MKIQPIVEGHGDVAAFPVLLRRLVAEAQRGLVSVQIRGRFPQNIWAVTEAGHPLEAQLENQEQGTYHGYPMSTTDPVWHAVVARWSDS